MSLIERAKIDTLRFTTDLTEWAVELTFLAPDTTEETISGYHTKHHFGIDSDGLPVNTKKAHVSFSEAALSVDYPLRNGQGEVNLRGHFVTVEDSTGTAKTYEIVQWFPDETLGLIVCILG